MPSSRDVEPARLRAALRKYCGYTSFLDQQEDAVRNVLLGIDTFLNLATGSGKSLCFQLPAAMLDGVTVVISPLVALMEDQVESLKQRGIPATMINGTLTHVKRLLAFSAVRRGKVKLLYLSPEQLATDSFYTQMEGAKVARLVIDEAHCVSMWGHDFRPDYQKIPEAWRRLGRPPRLALTATAPVRVRDDVLQMLEMEDADCIIGEINRPELVLKIEQLKTQRAKDRWLFPRLARHTTQQRKTVIFCSRIETVEYLYGELQGRKNVRCEMYHGQMETSERTDIARRFRDGETPILIATKAFGMGVDVADIRNIYHYELPDSVESYWQEVGRAARDRKRSTCYLLFSSRNIDRLHDFVRGNNITQPFVIKIWTALTRMIKGGGWTVEQPEVHFQREEWIENYCQEKTGLAARVRAALAQIEEHGMIRTGAGKVRFLVTPAFVKESGFPVTVEALKAKRDAAELRVKIFVHAILAGQRNFRRNILRHFRDNSLAEAVQDMDMKALYQVDDEVLDTIISAVSIRDVGNSALNKHLRGFGSTRGPLRGSLSDLTPGEARLDIRQAETMGYIRSVPIGAATFLTLTEKGGARLAEIEEEVPPTPTTYEELRPVMLSYLGKRVLREALDDWWQAQRDVSQQMWWPRLRGFLQRQFTILGEPVSGERLTNDYLHRTHTGPRRRTRYSGKVRGAISASHAKIVLNAIFDNQIRID